MVPNLGDPVTSANSTQLLQDQALLVNRGVDQGRGTAPSSAKHIETLPPAIDDFDTMINAEVKTFVNMSEEIGGLVAEQVHLSCHTHGTIPSDRLMPRDIVCRGTSLLRCGTQIPHHYNKSQEARHPVTCVHGNFDGAAVNDGSCQ